ncbi:MAG: hypothetical protein JKY92_06225 [Magnetovibrio sp.]|nr:hypothetical protein [Magnetovibrio sp.]
MTIRRGIWGGIMCGLTLFTNPLAGQAQMSQASQVSQASQAITTSGVLQETLKTCFSCHGENGISSMPSHPSIAGQKGDYIAKKLTAFKMAGKTHDANLENDIDDSVSNKGTRQGRLRADPVMEHMIKGLDSVLIVRVAETVSKLACRKETNRPKSRLYPAPRSVVECIACHGSKGLGKRTDTPVLAGQQRSYLRRQLLLIRETAWGALPREGESARAHPIMERQVARLKIQDVDVLAKYYSSLDCRGGLSKK